LAFTVLCLSSPIELFKKPPGKMTNGLPIARGETRLRFSGFTANIGDLKALPELAERLGMANPLRKHTKSPTKSRTGFWTGLFFILGRGIIP
jgi:hypothetical protein